MTPSLQVELVAPVVWNRELEQVQSDLTPGQQQVCRAILTTLHNRHIGITPLLAASLARMLDNHQTFPPRTLCWDPVFKRILAQASSHGQPGALLPHRVPLYTVLRIAAPIITQACQNIGLCYLFCLEDPAQENVTTAQYQRYHQQLEAQIQSLASATGELSQTFWLEQAHTLSTYSRRAPLWGATAPRLAEIHPPALSLMLGLSPKPQRTEAPALHPKNHLNPQQNRPVKRLREGGFSGIHIARGLEDMGDILLSEFLNPPAVLADRLINNGYLTLQRETRREQLRDVLVVGMLPATLGSGPGADFIRACWFDFIARFGFLLYRARLLRSEFRWLEGDHLGRVRSLPFLLKELPHPEIPPEGDLTPVFRHQFLTALGWLPGFLDARRPFEKIQTYRATNHQLQVSGEKDTAGERLWAYSAWRAQRENLLWHLQDPITPTPGREKRLDPHHYAYLHVMLFLPAAKRGPENSAIRIGPLFSGLGFQISHTGGQHLSASITWVPQAPELLSQWAFDCKECQTIPLFPGTQSPQNTLAIATRLQEVWRQRLLKELQDDR